MEDEEKWVCGGFKVELACLDYSHTSPTFGSDLWDFGHLSVSADIW